jgi:hypothetical protein
MGHVIEIETKRRIPLEDICDAITRSNSFGDFRTQISKTAGSNNVGDALMDTLDRSEGARMDFNESREILGYPPLTFQEVAVAPIPVTLVEKRKSRRRGKDDKQAE